MDDNSEHVLIALQLFSAGGAERQAGYLAEGLIAKGYKVTILAFGQASGLSYERYQKAGISALATGFREKLLLPERGIKAALLRLKYQRKLIQLVKDLKVDVIIPFTYPPNVIYGTLWRKMGARACFWNQRDEGRGYSGRKFELKALNNCSAIISNSLEGKLFLKKYTNQVISIIHNGIKIPAEIAKPDIVKDEFRVVMLANLHGFKDHLTLLKAWKLFMEQKPKARLLLAGQKGDAFDSLHQFVLENKLQESVDFLGQVSNVNALLVTCHLAVFSSTQEGLPNGILECMAVGLPVIANDSLGAKEALSSKSVFFPAGEYEKFAHKLSEFANDAIKRKKVGHLNRNQITLYFSLDTMVNHYVSLIEKSLNIRP